MMLDSRGRGYDGFDSYMYDVVLHYSFLISEALRRKGSKDKVIVERNDDKIYIGVFTDDNHSKYFDTLVAESRKGNTSIERNVQLLKELATNYYVFDISEELPKWKENFNETMENRVRKIDIPFENKGKEWMREIGIID